MIRALQQAAEAPRSNTPKMTLEKRFVKLSWPRRLKEKISRDPYYVEAYLDPPNRWWHQRSKMAVIILMKRRYGKEWASKLWEWSLEPCAR